MSYSRLGQIKVTSGAGPGPWSKHPKVKEFYAFVKQKNGPAAIVITDPAVMKLWSSWVAINPDKTPISPEVMPPALFNPYEATGIEGMLARWGIPPIIAIGGGMAFIVLIIIIAKR